MIFVRFFNFLADENIIIKTCHKNEPTPSKPSLLDEPDFSVDYALKISHISPREITKREAESKLREEFKKNNQLVIKNTTLAKSKTILSDIRESSHEYESSSKYGNNSIYLESDSRMAYTIIRENKTNLFNENLSLRTIDKFDSVATLEKIRAKDMKTIEEIQSLTGLFKEKFDAKKIDEIDYYKPWECASIKEDKIEENYKDFEKRKKLVKFCKNTFLKVYPSMKRFDSTNFDPVKAWICGVQMAAMNLQSSNEDHMLIHKVFFKINRNCGYVLKPDFLRNIGDSKYGFVEYNRTYQNFQMKISLTLISALMLYNIQKKNKTIEEFSIFCYLVGSWEDDNLNQKFLSKKYKTNLLNSILENEIYIFNIYEPQLSFIIIKIINDGDVVARTAFPICLIQEGIRIFSFFDDMLDEIKDSRIAMKISKTEI
jgi:hypothetical protein